MGSGVRWRDSRQRRVDRSIPEGSPAARLIPGDLEFNRRPRPDAEGGRAIIVRERRSDVSYPIVSFGEDYVQKVQCRVTTQRHDNDIGTPLIPLADAFSGLID